MGHVSADTVAAARSADFTSAVQDGTWLTVAAGDPVFAPAIDALLQAAPPNERQAIVLNAVCEEIARVLRLPASQMPGKRERLMDLGLDSLTAIELRNRLAARLGIENLSATLIFDYPTPDAIAGYLLDCVQGASMPVEIFPAQPIEEEKMLTADEVADIPDEEIAILLRSRLSR
jgi:acyl carrier protein